jgi:uncharacterized membrane protein
MGSTLLVALIFILAASSLGPVYSVSAAISGNVHGTIVDEDGSPLRDVKVLAYLNAGGLATTRYTDSDGYFRLALDGGSFTLQFEKDGYVTGEESITLSAGWVNDPDNDPVQFGEIVLRDAIQLKASILSQLAGPGETINIDFTLSNTGDESEEIEFIVDAPEDWDTRVLSSENEIKKVLLDSGSLSLELEATISSTFDEQATITLTALGKLDTALDFTIFPKASAHPEIELVSTYLSVSEELGKTIYLPLTVENEGETDEIIELTAEGPSGWSIKFITGSEMAVNSLYLVSGDSEELSVKVSPSEEALIGDYYVDIRAMSEDGVLRDSLRLRVNLREATSDVEVISTFTDVTAEAGDTINFPLAIWNRGETDALFLLTVLSAPANWKTVFMTDDVEVSSVLVMAGESMTLQLEVKPPSTIKAGAYPIVVYTESDDGLISKQIDIEVKIVGSYRIELELSTLYTTITIGDSMQLSVDVANWGYSTVTSVYIDAAIPDDWEITTTPSQIATLDPKQSATFNLVVETSADTVAGDYLITVQAFSDQMESDDADVRVTAKASTSWGYIGIGLALIIVIGLAFTFTRFKRR